MGTLNSLTACALSIRPAGAEASSLAPSTGYWELGRQRGPELVGASSLPWRWVRCMAWTRTRSP